MEKKKRKKDSGYVLVTFWNLLYRHGNFSYFSSNMVTLYNFCPKKSPL
jgi:hypothetical protein